MADHKIHTTINPDEVTVVNDAELLDLRRAGLVIEKTANKKEEN